MPADEASEDPMRGDDEIIALLNEQLTSELTAINQYFLHAKMQQNWGLTKLAAHTKAESIDEMRHAEKITDRILFLDGLPNYQRLFPLRIGQTVKEQLESDLAVEVEVVERQRQGRDVVAQGGEVGQTRIVDRDHPVHRSQEVLARHRRVVRRLRHRVGRAQGREQVARGAEPVDVAGLLAGRVCSGAMYSGL